MKVKTTQRLVTGVAIVTALLVLGLSAKPLARRFFMVNVVPNVILVKEPSATSYWQLTKTPKGFLIQAKAGRYRGWYLDAEETLSQEIIDGEIEPMSSCVVLCREFRESCYWEIEVSQIRAATDPFHGRRLGIAVNYELSKHDVVRSTEHLVIGSPTNGSWKITDTQRGHVIRATTPDRQALAYDATIDSQPVWKRSVEDRRRTVQQARLLEHSYPPTSIPLCAGGTRGKTSKVRKDFSSTRALSLAHPEKRHANH